MSKQTFILHNSYKEKLKALSQSQKGDLLDALFHYSATGETPKLEPILKMAFDFIRVDIDTYNSNYDETCERNRENVLKRWGKRKEDTTVYDRIRPKRSNTNDTNDTNHTDKDKDKDKDNKLLPKGNKERKAPNPTVSYLIELFQDTFGYPATSRYGQTPRQQAWVLIRKMHGKMKEYTAKERDAKVRSISKTYFTWVKKQDWGGEVVSFHPLRDNLLKFIAKVTNGEIRL